MVPKHFEVAFTISNRLHYYPHHSNKGVGWKILNTRSTGGQNRIFNLLHENQWVGWNLFLEKNKQACPFIREVRVHCLTTRHIYVVDLNFR